MKGRVRIFQVMAVFTFCLFMGIMVMVFFVAKSQSRGVTYADPVVLQKCRYDEQMSHSNSQHKRVSWQHVEVSSQ